MDNQNGQPVTLKAYKGFDKDLKCRSFQYEIGGEYKTDAAECCEKGFHACEAPLDVLKYYPPGSGARYCEVEQSGDLSRESGNDSDTKVASTEIKIGAEIGIPGLAKAHVEWVRRHITHEQTAGDSGAATAGYSGAATAGDSGAATAGDRGVATAGYSGAANSRGKSSVGKNGCALARGNNVRVKGNMGAILVLAEERVDSYDIHHWKAFVVDGETYKPDVWYKLSDSGEVLEADGDEETA